MAEMRRPMRVPRKPTMNLDGGEKEGGHSCLLPIILLLIVGGAIGTYVYLHYTGFRKEEPEIEEVAPPKPVEQKPVTPEPVVEPEKPAEPEPPPPPKEKTVAELKAEADVAQKELDAKIAEARKASAGKELPGFAGARFGDVAKGTPITTERLSVGSLPDCGYGVALQGPVLKSAFRGFGDRPVLWVTPKTYKIYRIEFSRNLNGTPGPRPDPETTNLVALLSKKMRRDPLGLDAEKYPYGRREYVFPFGATSLKVCECGGGVLKLVAENENMYAQVKAESEELRKADLAKTFPDKALSSDKYPDSGKVKLGGIRLKKGTPRHFCGIAFGSLPPYGAKVSKPLKGTWSAYLNYSKFKCRPFANFEHGRAELGRSNGAVVAVELFSAGATEGLTEEEYFAKVRRTLEARYGVKPRETKGDGAMPTLTYGIGDVDLTFGPDPAGGFRLRAENTTLKALW